MMTDGVLAIADRHAQWLLARQAVVSQNLANIDTPGFVGKDLRPFEIGASNRADQLWATVAGHLRGPAAETQSRFSVRDAFREEKLSGNTIGLESEMGRMAETHRQFSMNNAIVKLFHRLQIMNLKGAA